MDDLLKTLGLERSSSADIIEKYRPLLGDLPFIPRKGNLPSNIPDVVIFVDQQKNHPHHMWAAAVHQLLSISPGRDGATTELPKSITPRVVEDPLWKGGAIRSLVRTALVTDKPMVQLRCKLLCGWTGTQSTKDYHHQHICATNKERAKTKAEADGWQIVSDSIEADEQEYHVGANAKHKKKTKNTAITHSFKEISESETNDYAEVDLREIARNGHFVARIPTGEPIPTGTTGIISISGACQWYQIPLTPASEQLYKCHNFNDLPAILKQRLWWSYTAPGDGFYDVNDTSRGSTLLLTSGSTTKGPATTTSRLTHSTLSRRSAATGRDAPGKGSSQLQLDLSGPLKSRSSGSKIATTVTGSTIGGPAKSKQGPGDTPAALAIQSTSPSSLEHSGGKVRATRAAQKPSAGGNVIARAVTADQNMAMQSARSGFYSSIQSYTTNYPRVRGNETAVSRQPPKAPKAEAEANTGSASEAILVDDNDDHADLPAGPDDDDDDDFWEIYQ